MAEEKRFPAWIPNEILNEFLPPLSSFVPSSFVILNYGGQVGTKNSIRSKYLSTFSKPRQRTEYWTIGVCALSESHLATARLKALTRRFAFGARARTLLFAEKACQPN